MMAGHQQYRFFVQSVGQAGERYRCRGGIQVEVESRDVVDDMVDHRRHRHLRHGVTAARIDQRLRACDPARGQQGLQQGRVVLAIAHAVVQHHVEVARHHRAQADAVAGVADVARHPFVQALGGFARLFRIARGVVGQLADARRDGGLRFGAFAIRLGDGRIACERGIGVTGIALVLEHAIAQAFRIRRLAVAPLPFDAAAAVAHAIAGFVQLPGFVLRSHRFRRIDADPHVAVVRGGAEVLDHRELAIEHRLAGLEAIREDGGIAYREIGEHRRQRGLVRIERRVPVLPGAAVDLEIAGRHRDAAAIGLQCVGHDISGFLDAGAVTDRRAFRRVQRGVLQDPNGLFARFGVAAVRIDGVGDDFAFHLERQFALARLRDRHRKPDACRHGGHKAQNRSHPIAPFSMQHTAAGAV